MLNRIASIFLIILSITICLMSYKLGIGEVHDPGSGFMPLVTSLFMLFLSIVVLIRDLLGKRESKDEKLLLVKENLKKPSSLIAALIGYALLLDVLGYLVTTFLLMFLMFYSFDPKKWGVNIVISAIASSLSFFIFHKWLQVQLPAGIFHLGF